MITKESCDEPDNPFLRGESLHSRHRWRECPLDGVARVAEFAQRNGAWLAERVEVDAGEVWRA
jgi:hypothetical protein